MARGGLINKLEEWAQVNNIYLKKYVNSSGEITRTIRHNAAIRYLKLAEDLDFVTKSGEMYGITKYGQVLVNIPKITNNRFELDLFEICIFLRRILLKDLDGLTPVFGILNSGSGIQAEIQAEYKAKLLDVLKSKEKKCKDLSEKIPYREHIDKIQRWTNEKKYLENLVPPRLNWLLDLKLIDWGKYKSTLTYELNNAGSRMAKELFLLNETDDTNEEWFENGYYSAFYEAYKSDLPKMKSFKGYSANIRKKIIRSYITEAFPIFKWEKIPRMTLSVFFEYTCTKLLIKEGIVCGFNDLKEELERIAAFEKSIQFRWIPSKNDGFLVRMA